MNDRPDEDRSWTDAADPDRAVEEMRSGISRLKNQVADFRQQMSNGASDNNSDDDSSPSA